MQNPLQESDLFRKILLMEEVCHHLLSSSLVALSVPDLPGRDVLVVNPREMPTKKGLSYCEGQGQMLHDLANIELQAAELGLRTLIEFPTAPPLFRESLAVIVLEEISHLKLCLDGLDQLGYSWGHWPVHLQLWNSTNAEDDLLDRLLIVHRYLEGAGLDASSILLKRLSGVESPILYKPIKVIAQEEERHVHFGSLWFKKLCAEQGLDSDREFDQRFVKLFTRLPRRMERMNVELRKKAGFTDAELHTILRGRELWQAPH